MKKNNLVLMMLSIMLTMCVSLSCAQSNNSEPTKAIDAPAATKISDNNALPQVLDFSATWCGPCRKFAPQFHEAKALFKNRATFRTIDIDENPSLAASYNIEAVPTVIILNAAGKEIKRFVGVPEYDVFIAEVEAAIK